MFVDGDTDVVSIARYEKHVKMTPELSVYENNLGETRRSLAVTISLNADHAQTFHMYNAFLSCLQDRSNRLKTRRIHPLTDARPFRYFCNTMSILAHFPNLFS